MTMRGGRKPPDLSLFLSEAAWTKRVQAAMSLTHLCHQGEASPYQMRKVPETKPVLSTHAFLAFCKCLDGTANDSAGLVAIIFVDDEGQIGRAHV